VTGTADSIIDDDIVLNAFLWDGTTLHDLNALIDPADPLQPFVALFQGVDINDRGQILVYGLDSRTGETHTYIVTPFSAPTRHDRAARLRSPRSRCCATQGCIAVPEALPGGGRAWD